jgi:protein-disulfide isomerase
MSTTGNADKDLTRKGRREEARAQRKALEEAESARAARRRRLTQLGGLIAVVAVIIVVIVVATGSGGGSGSKGIVKGKAANATVSEVNSELQGIAQSGFTLGSPKAPVTLQYFGDLECPICQQFTLGALPPLISKYVRSGKLKIEYRSLQTATREPSIFTDQQIAALAAGKQNRMWNFVELFYHEQGQEDSGYVTEGYLQGLAKQVTGLNLGKWASDRNDSALATQVATDEQAATRSGFTGTPSFLLGKSGGTLSVFTAPSLTDSSGFEAAINQLLA